MINVTKTYLPSFDRYINILKRAWEKAWITNNGELVQELEKELKEYLGVKYLLFTGNGTIVLQMSLKALNITKEVITTPFSYVATTNAILWEGCTPVFVDIRRDNFCIDADKIESAITENTQAILATHVYGMPCDINKIEKLAQKYKLKVIYDGAHAFGCITNGRSLLSYGDVSTCSFHATKIFHTVEGGCIVCHHEELYKKLSLYRSFGHISDEYFSVGINAKNSEFHAAMGLAILPEVKNIIRERKKICDIYSEKLKNTFLNFICYDDKTRFNYAYFPIIFPSEKILLDVKGLLERNEINTRRYFYPSLNTLPFLSHTNPCPVSEDIALRVLCLPLYPGLSTEDVNNIVSIILSATK